MPGLTKKTVRLVLLAATVLGLAAAGAAYASIPDSEGLIHGCYNPNGSKGNGGAPLNVVDTASASCKGAQQEVTWDQTTSAYDSEGSKVIPGDDSWNTVDSMSIPAGSYVVSATLRLNQGAAPGSTNVTCVVVGDHTSVLDASGDSTVQQADVVMMPLLGRAAGDASTLELQCQSTSVGVGIDAFMVATKLGVIHDGA